VATVKGVVDGATVRIVPEIEGAHEVRPIGVDAPEAGRFDAGDQPYGEQATRFTRSVLDGKKVGLVFEPERKDRVAATLQIRPYREMLPRLLGIKLAEVESLPTGSLSNLADLYLDVEETLRPERVS
jgi:micrococcal nuclease